MAITINGSGTITGISAGGLPDDSINLADLSATGTASSSTFLRGDNSWATPAAATNTPAFSVHKGGDSGSHQSIPTYTGASDTTKVTWSHEYLDTDNCFASNKFTPTSAGYYWFNVNLLMNYGEAEDEYATIFVYKNGSSIFEARQIEGVGTMSQSLKANFMVEANGSGDYFEIYVNQFSGDATNIDRNNTCTWWNGFKLIGLS